MNLSKSIENDLLIAKFLGIEVGVYKTKHHSTQWLYTGDYYDPSPWHPYIPDVIQHMRDQGCFIEVRTGYVNTHIRISQGALVIEIENTGDFEKVFYQAIIKFLNQYYL